MLDGDGGQVEGQINIGKSMVNRES